MKYKGLLVFNLISLVFYCIIIVTVLNHAAIQELIYSTPDSTQYRDFGRWLLHTGPGTCSDTRPFLYPAVSQLFDFIGGANAVWFLQFGLYMLAINLLYRSIFDLTRNVFFAFTGGILLSFNLSVIVMTLHGLTEMACIFLFTVLIAIVTKMIREGFTFNRMLLIVLLFVTLTMVKPVFSTFIWLSLVLLVYRFYRELKQVRNLSLLAAVIAPVLFQLCLMKINYNEAFISKIGHITLRDYYYRMLYTDVHNIPFDNAPDITEEQIQHTFDITAKATTSDIVFFSMAHPRRAASIYAFNLRDNVKAFSPMVYMLKIPSWTKWMDNVNLFYYYLHLLFLIVIPLTAKRAFLTFGKSARGLFALYSVAAFIILSSGISFYQGDRLILPALPLWVFVYAVFGHLKIQKHGSVRLK